MYKLLYSKKNDLVIYVQHSIDKHKQTLILHNLHDHIGPISYSLLVKLKQLVRAKLVVITTNSSFVQLKMGNGDIKLCMKTIVLMQGGDIVAQYNLTLELLNVFFHKHKSDQCE